MTTSAYHQDAPTRRLTRSREGIWLTGVCRGIATYLRIDPAIVRFVFALMGLAGGIGVVAYVFAWLIMPLEADTTNVNAKPEADVRGLVVGLLIAGGIAAALLLAGRGASTLGAAIVIAPLVIAVGGVIVRRGSPSSKRMLLAVGLGITLVLAPLNYRPTFGNHTVYPFTQDFHPQYTNLFGTLTLDLSDSHFDSGNLTLNVNSVGGAVVLRVPDNAWVEIDNSSLFDSSRIGGDESLPGGRLLIKLKVHGAFSSIRVVR